MPMNEEKLNHLMGKFVSDLGAILHAGMVVIGESLGLYKAMRGSGSLTSAELVDCTDTRERYVREWLNSQAAGGYVEYDPATGRYSLLWPFPARLPGLAIWYTFLEEGTGYEKRQSHHFCGTSTTTQ